MVFTLTSILTIWLVRIQSTHLACAAQLMLRSTHDNGPAKPHWCPSSPLVCLQQQREMLLRESTQWTLCGWFPLYTHSIKNCSVEELEDTSLPACFSILLWTCQHLSLGIGAGKGEDAHKRRLKQYCYIRAAEPCGTSLLTQSWVPL